MTSFVNQQPAGQGLSVIDILAAVLDISEEQRSILRCWYERHAAYYRITATSDQKTEVRNIINDKLYIVANSTDKILFKVGEVVFGSLVPWNGEWYWSGAQYRLKDLSEADLFEKKDTFLKTYPQIIYRYYSEAGEKARKAIKRHYQEFVQKHNDDMIMYPDGLSMVADYQKDVRLQWESQPKEVIDDIVKRNKLKDAKPDLSFPAHLLENNEGIGVFFNPDEGQEIMTGFNDIISGLKKKGIGLNKNEQEGIQSFITSDSVSPAFVRRLIQEYGTQSIEAAFLLQNDHDEYHIDYLLRRYKGHYYRNRYPNLTLI